ncbi:MAG: hypothetical protein JW715_15650 [Sedimentisphaerales bacterium]|nr:hypothetical protein [Sedimentisphaerales bacterium]
MAENFSFSKTRIDEHTIKVGVDIRPVIEPKLDRVKLFDVGQKLVDKYPNLFESLVQSPTEFLIRKKFVFPGKGEVDLPTLAITPRGVVFIFPQRLSLFQEEIQLNNIDDVSLDGLKIFRGSFAGKMFCRVGLVNEYIFDTGQIESTELVCSRFTKVKVPQNGEIVLNINRPDDDYNKKIQLKPVQKIERDPNIPGVDQVSSYGVQVVVDFNNRDMSNDLDENHILGILHKGKQYNNNELYDFLNGSFGEV